MLFQNHAKHSQPAQAIGREVLIQVTSRGINSSDYTSSSINCFDEILGVCCDSALAAKPNHASLGITRSAMRTSSSSWLKRWQKFTQHASSDWQNSSIASVPWAKACENRVCNDVISAMPAALSRSSSSNSVSASRVIFLSMGIRNRAICRR